MSMDCFYDSWKKYSLCEPIKEIYHFDASKSYEMNVHHIFLLENKKYMVVIEVGCSCYDPDEDAQIFICETENEARSRLSQMVGVF